MVKNHGRKDELFEEKSNLGFGRKPWETKTSGMQMDIQEENLDSRSGEG